MRQRIKTVLCSYGVIVRPWLCVVAYLWALELQAAYRDYSEPFVDVLADTALILWTLSLWAALLAAVVTSAALFLHREALHRANDLICRILCILVSGFFLNRWIESWWPEELNRATNFWLLILAVALLYLWARRRRIRASALPTSIIPIWQDCFRYLALPVLFLTVAVVGLKVSVVVIAQSKALASLPKVSLPRTRAATTAMNVIVFVSDSLRAQSLSFYRRGGADTPFLERLASMSSVYLEMHANATTTAPSILSLISGRHPIAHGRLNWQMPASPDQRNVLALLRQAGYTTAAVTSNDHASLTTQRLTDFLSEPEVMAFRFLPFSWLSRLGVYPTRIGLRVYENMARIVPFLGFPERTSINGNVADTLERARRLIPRLREPFFLFIHIHEPHDPHRLPADFRIVIPAQQWNSAGVMILAIYSHYAPVLQPAVDAYRVQYETAVRAVDSELDKFFGFIEKQAWFSKSLVMFTADHGESFERGYLYHGEELYENSTRVPLLIRFPEQKLGESVGGLVQLTDIAPTILNALNIPVPAWMEGQALMQGTPPAERATVAVNYKQPDTDAIYPLPTKLAIWWRRYKLITGCDYGPIELYDLANDPGEQVNLAARQTEMVAELRLKLKQHLAKQSQPARLTCAKLS